MFQEFTEMEKCFEYDVKREDEWEAYIRYAASHDSFFVRYSAAAAIEIYGKEKHIPILLKILEREELDPVYGQPAGLKNTDAAAGDIHVGEIGFPEKTDGYEKAAWQRRGKLKQAACLAADGIYRRERPVSKNERLIELLHQYAADQREDYSVRAAAAKTLRAAGDSESLPVLRLAAQDPEFCTSLEARKSIASIEEGKKVSYEGCACFAENPKLNEEPFMIDDVKELRNKVLHSESEFVSRLWNRIKSGMRNGGYPWFEPFGAMITQDEKDIKRAKKSIGDYVDSLERLRYNPGVHFHSWCFAFPHARLSLCFQWLYAMKAFSAEEAEEIEAQLVSHQFLYYHSCYRVKPDPETVDNQTLSLAISDALIGYIFGNEPFNSRIARIMFGMSIKRVADILERMGKEGYSGEGSTYMNHVIASCIPLGVELLERIYKKDYFHTCKNTAEMLGREVMPDGFALPWDHYGYILPTLQGLSYNSRRIRGRKYVDLLENYADYSFSVITGWGFDDLVWTLIWYNAAPGEGGTRGQCGAAPKRETQDGCDEEGTTKEFESWFIPDTAGCIISDDMQLGLVQMFDHAETERISRYHCNPNALILSAYGVPLLTEGYPSAECARFQFRETARTFDFMSIEPVTVNDGYGCAGAHSVILVDGYEAMRPVDDSCQLAKSEFDRGKNMIYADVTPVYKQNFKDAALVERRSRLCADKFWIVEDRVHFEKEHSFAMRLITRPDVCRDGDMLYVRTPECVELTVIELEGNGKVRVEPIGGYPNTLEQRSVIIDNIKSGKKISWKHLLFPHDCKKLLEDISEGWKVVTDRTASLSFDEAYRALSLTEDSVPITAPVYFFKQAPAAKKLWYFRKIRNPGCAFILRLPRNLHRAVLWINGKKCPAGDSGLLDLYVKVKEQQEEWIEVIVSAEVGTAQYGDTYNGGGFFGRAAVYKELPHEKINVIKDGLNITIEAYGEKYDEQGGTV